MNQVKPRRIAEQAEQLQATATILFKPDAHRVSKREIELTMSVFDEVLLAMSKIEAEALAKSSSFIQKVEPCADSAIEVGPARSNQE